jgi:hypothetical protein
VSYASVGTEHPKALFQAPGGHQPRRMPLKRCR